jgi:type I protein arginine methyltransferase
MTETTGYSISSYGEMITDDSRMAPYVEALQRAVQPGYQVVDIGAGTGIFSLLACRFGAGHVHCIEPDNAVQVARQMVHANGFADRITFYQTLSTDVTLAIKADVIVSDLRGVLPLLQHHIPSIIDARKRLLAPGGVLIPQRDTLWAALIEAPKTYEPYVKPWLENDFDLDLRAAQPLVVNTWRKVNAKAEQLLIEPLQWATLDYRTIESPDVAGELTWIIDRPGTAHGLLLWFDAELADGIGFSNAPGGPELIYGQAFFPLEKPVSLEPDDWVKVRLRANLASDDYIWQWRTKVTTGGTSGFVKANFAQSTFFGSPISANTLRRQEAAYKPALDEAGLADRFILSLMDGRTTLDDIARRANQEFPARFPHWKDALTRAGELSAKYAR